VRHVGDATVDGTRVTCTVRGSIAPLLVWLTAHDVVELDSRELSLEEVFVSEFSGDPQVQPTQEQRPAAH
jgi:ABC-2 type transport system ATP-binding protein